MKAVCKLVAIAFACVSLSAHAGFVTLDLSGFVNSDLTTDYTNGSSYPGPGPTTVGGVPFQLAPINGSDTGVFGGLAFGSAVAERRGWR